MLAINNSASGGLPARPAAGPTRRGAGLAGLALLLATVCTGANPNEPGGLAAQDARTLFRERQEGFEAQPDSVEAAWQFARACFQWAEFARNDAQRAEIAEPGIEASRRAISLNPNSAAGHYYLALNLGQLARTKTLGALRLVSEMEQAFLRARELDPTVDYYGPDRGLGLLYLEAPVWLTGLGNKARARAHLRTAVEGMPFFPENRLQMVEAWHKLGDARAARRELEALEELLPEMQKRFEGEEWIHEWTGWTARLAKLRAKDSAPAVPSRRRW